MSPVAPSSVPGELPSGRRVVLLVEDEPDDIFFMEMAWAEEKISVPLHVCENGVEAIEYLAGMGIFQDRTAHPLPCMVITDLKLPGVDGFELLAWLQKQPQFRSIPKLVLTSGDRDGDRERAFELGATDYLVKPVSVPERSLLVRMISEKWLKQGCT